MLNIEKGFATLANSDIEYSQFLDIETTILKVRIFVPRYNLKTVPAGVEVKKLPNAPLSDIV